MDEIDSLLLVLYRQMTSENLQVQLRALLNILP